MLFSVTFLALALVLISMTLSFCDSFSAFYPCNKSGWGSNYTIFLCAEVNVRVRARRRCVDRLGYSRPNNIPGRKKSIHPYNIYGRKDTIHPYNTNGRGETYNPNIHMILMEERKPSIHIMYLEGRNHTIHRRYKRERKPSQCKDPDWLTETRPGNLPSI